MNKRVSNLRSQLKYEYSPFVFTESTSITLQKDNQWRIISRGSEMIRSREMSNEMFISCYVDLMCRWINITPPGRKVLRYIFTVLPSKSDVVTIELNEIMAHTRYSSDVSIYDGLNDLVNLSIIARSMTPFVFYVNTRYLMPDNIVQFCERIVRNNQAVAERNGILEQNKKSETSSRYLQAADNQNVQKKDLYQMLTQKEKK
jgi:hypothetical protein